ncbi:TPA: pantetheine-phosphate adenylyltransferase [Candidatus Bathyarchaeota archaeon]|nr:pantetheine-phosphate adenylyltransferase [Candidatus Bathyarchaeota archaeon]
MWRFKLVAVGGTFDELHRGHKTIILKAFKIGEKVIIGLCTDAFARRLRKNHEISSYTKRLGELVSFLRKNGLLDRAEIIPLNDPYGPTVKSKDIDAIVVSRETEPRAHDINDLRKAIGLKPLHIITIDMVPAYDEIPISTTRIYRGEIDREGNPVKILQIKSEFRTCLKKRKM